MQTLTEQLVEALEKLAARHDGYRQTALGSCICEGHTLAHLALDRYRAEPECTAACDQPSEQHCTSGCPCYQAGYMAGYKADLDLEALLREAGRGRRGFGERVRDAR